MAKKRKETLKVETIRKLTSTKVKKYTKSALHAIGMLFIAFMLWSKVWGTDASILKYASFGDFEPFMCVIIIALSVVIAGFGIAGIITALKGKKFSSTAFGINFVVLVIITLVGSVLSILGTGGKLALALAIIIELVGFIYSVMCNIFGHADDSENEKEKQNVSEKADTRLVLDPTFNAAKFRAVTLAISTISMLFLLLVFFVPFCKYTIYTTDKEFSIIPISFGKIENSMFIGIPVFALLFIAYSVAAGAYLSVVSAYKQNFERLLIKAKKTVYGNVIICAIYFLASVIFCFWKNIKGEKFSTSSVIPLVFTLVAAIAFAVVEGVYSDRVSLAPKSRKANFRKIELLVYGIVIGAISLLSLLTDIIVVRFDIAGSSISGIKLNGMNLLTLYPQLGGGFQLAAFFIFVFLVVSITMTVLMVISLISRSRLYYKIAAFAITANAFIAFAVGVVGKYYQIATKINQETLLSLIGKYVNIDGIDFTYQVTSKSFWLFIAAMLVLAIALFRVPYTKGLEAQEENGWKRPRKKNLATEGTSGSTPKNETEDASESDFDACPAFTELDSRTIKYAMELQKRLETPFERPTLPSLVQFVVDYARDSRLHLSYTVDDIAAFVAGLGATKLTILQGMSGTGKTSLPKIFLEALMGNCEIVEVESSWRDKNELLGYYNEFSKTYTPKKFTQALYKAKLNPEIIVFIVLDEMNLSRIEYYFSDFLSLMENEEDKREIKLLNVKLYNTVDGEKYSYTALSEDHTLKVPSNVWFIGTANRDESTFEISDKVYDRAHTMNFNKRAKKPVSYGSQPLEARYLSYKELVSMLEAAKAASDFDIERVEVIKEVEDILSSYNISFGNRIARQIEDFVKIYCACFYDGEQRRAEAVEKILLSKVVSKLEYKNVDNKEALAIEFERLGLNRCAEFVRKLNED